MAASKKEKKIWISILEQYKNMPHLWDKNNAHYLNRNMRDEGFNTLLEMYKEFDNDATIPTLKRKIDNLRTSYSRELKKVKASIENGTAERHIPSLWYFDLLSFLREGGSESSREPSDIIEEKPDTQESGHGSSNRTRDETDGTIKEKKRRTIIAKKQDDLLNTVKQLINDKEEKFETLGRAIGIQLRDIESKHQLDIANKIIADVIFYAKRGILNEDASVNLGTSQINKQNNATGPQYPYPPSPQYISCPQYTQSHEYRIPLPCQQIQPTAGLLNNDSPSPPSSTHSLSPKPQVLAHYPSDSVHDNNSALLPSADFPQIRQFGVDVNTTNGIDIKDIIIKSDTKLMVKNVTSSLNIL